jgi:hypothetical protein
LRIAAIQSHGTERRPECRLQATLWEYKSGASAPNYLKYLFGAEVAWNLPVQKQATTVRFIEQRQNRELTIRNQ